MKIFFKSIYYIYDVFVYKGILLSIHGEGYSKIHAIGIISFLQLLNIITIDNLANNGWLLKLPKLFPFLLAMAIYVYNSYYNRNYVLQKPSMKEIYFTLLYIFVSIFMTIISFQK
jgi:hypothetical protein